MTLCLSNPASGLRFHRDSLRPAPFEKKAFRSVLAIAGTTLRGTSVFKQTISPFSRFDYFCKISAKILFPVYAPKVSEVVVKRQKVKNNSTVRYLLKIKAIICREVKKRVKERVKR